MSQHSSSVGRYEMLVQFFRQAVLVYLDLLVAFPRSGSSCPPGFSFLMLTFPKQVKIMLTVPHKCLREPSNELCFKKWPCYCDHCSSGSGKSTLFFFFFLKEIPRGAGGTEILPGHCTTLASSVGSQGP